MARSIPTTEPTTFAAGETVDWTRTVGDYPSSDYTLRYYFAGPDTFTITATADGEGYLIEIPASTTTGKTAGTYQWRAYAEAGSEDDGDFERYEVDRGVVVLEANFATAAAGSMQTHAERTLAVLEAAIEGRLSADLESYSIGGRQVTKIPAAELVKLRNQYAAAVFRERHGAFGPRLEVRFA